MRGFHHRRLAMTLAMILGVVMLSAACAGSTVEDAGDPTTTSTLAASTSSTETTTTTSLPTTTTSPATTTTTWYAVPDPLNRWALPTSYPGSDGALGSGCRPDSEILPDGIWAAYLIEHTDEGVEVDIICAERQPDDPWVSISNTSPGLRTVPVDDSASVFLLGYQGDEGAFLPGYEAHLVGPIPYASWGTEATAPCPDPGCPTWLSVNGGRITEIVQFWFPRFTVRSLEAAMVGSWVGTNTNPWTKPYDIAIRFDDGSAEVHGSMTDQPGGPPYLETALYWGSDDEGNDPVERVWYVTAVDEFSGEGSGQIALVWRPEGTVRMATMQSIRMSTDLDSLVIEVWDGSYGPLILDLTRD